MKSLFINIFAIISLPKGSLFGDRSSLIASIQVSKAREKEMSLVHLHHRLSMCVETWLAETAIFKKYKHVKRDVNCDKINDAFERHIF